MKKRMNWGSGTNEKLCILEQTGANFFLNDNLNKFVISAVNMCPVILCTHCRSFAGKCHAIQRFLKKYFSLGLAAHAELKSNIK